MKTARQRVQKVHPWYFLVIAIAFGAIALVQLRHNNEGMIVRREAVYEADKNGGDVEGTLQELRTYVYSHMNTSLTSGNNAVYPPIQLKYTYEREQAKRQAQLGPGNSNIYHQAELACENQGAASGAATIACIEDYAAAQGITLSEIPEGLYKFDFTSAKWSPDLAGWAIVAMAISLILFIDTALYRWWRKLFQP